MRGHLHFSILSTCAALGAVGSSACGSGAADDAVVVRDSAGVAIVESRAPVWTPGREWRVAERPAIEIGEVEGDEPYRLFRVVDATVLSDGRIAVLNHGTHELRIYAPDGRHRRTVGGEGDGPGELRFPLRLLRLPGDSLAVVDRSRVSVFDAAGDFVRSWRYDPPPPQERLADGSLLGLAYLRAAAAPDLGAVTPGRALIRVRPGGGAPDTLARLDGGDQYRVRAGESILSFGAPLGRTLSLAAAGDRIVTGDGSAFEFAVLAPDGAPERVVRRTADLTLRPEDVARFEEAYLADAPNESVRRLRARVLREAGVPDRRPAYDRLLVDRGGNVWARHYAIVDEPRRWSVFDPSGRWLGVVGMPAGLEVLEIGADYVLGTATDSLDVEYVRLHRLAGPHTPQPAPGG